MWGFTIKNKDLVEIVGLAILVALLFGVLLWWVLPTDVPSKQCETWNLSCISGQISGGINSVRYTVSFWSVTHLVAQIVIVTFGIIATISIGLLDDSNKHWTKPLGLFSSTLVAGLTSGLITLQVPERVDKFVSALDAMTISANRLLDEYEQKLDGITQDSQIKAKYEQDSTFRADLNKIFSRGLNDYNREKIKYLKIGGTATRLVEAPEKPKEEPKPENKEAPKQ